MYGERGQPSVRRGSILSQTNRQTEGKGRGSSQMNIIKSYGVFKGSNISVSYFWLCLHPTPPRLDSHPRSLRFVHHDAIHVYPQKYNYPKSPSYDNPKHE